MGRLKPGVSLDQANAEFVGLAKRLAKDNPKTNGQLVSASVQPLLEYIHRSATAPDRLRHARGGRHRSAHRVRERDEHAIRPRRACGRKSWPFAARSARLAGVSFGK